MYKRYFKQMTFREQILLTVFIWVILILLFNMSLKWSRSSVAEFNRNTVEIKAQDEVFAKKSVIDTELEETLKLFDPGKTFNGERLLQEVDVFATNLKLRNRDFKNPKVKDGDLLTLYSMPYVIKNYPIEKLVAFEESIRNEFPYIGISSLVITVKKSDPKFLTANFIINSFELKQ